MRFFDDGRMLYSLDTVEPDDMAKHLILGTVVPKKIFEGRYTLVGKTVHVEVSYYSPYHNIRVFIDICRSCTFVHNLNFDHANNLSNIRVSNLLLQSIESDL